MPAPFTPVPGTAADRRLAVLAMIASSFLFAGMSVFTKLATRPAGGAPAIPGGEIALFRYLGGLAFLFAVSVARGISLLGTDRRGLIWRGVSGGIASTCFFLGIQFTSLTNATLLNYTFVIWGPLLAFFSLRERLTRRTLFAVLVALCGVGLVTHPEIGHIHAGDVIALFSGFMAGNAIVSVRRLRQGESSLAIFFYFNLIGIPISLSTLPILHTHLLLPNATQGLILLGVCATSVAGQLLMTYGYRALTTAEGSLTTLTTVVYSALCGTFLFQEPLTWQTLVGGALILYCAAILSAKPNEPARHGTTQKDTTS